MTSTLTITVIVESVIVLGYCYRHGKPISPVLLTSICANIITQSLLRAVLHVFFEEYLFTLFIVEISIWALESFALYFIPANKLRFSEAITLSLFMNAISLAVGWFLPT